MEEICSTENEEANTNIYCEFGSLDSNILEEECASKPINAPWFVPHAIINEEKPETLPELFLNKIIYIVDHEASSMHYFYELIQQGIRIFLIKLQYNTHIRFCRIIRDVKFATEKYKECFNKHIDVCVGYEILSRHAYVGKVENDEAIIVSPAEKVHITVDRSFAYHSTKMNLYVNCREYLHFLMQSDFKYRGEHIIIGDNVIMEILNYSDIGMECICRNESTISINSLDRVYFRQVLTIDYITYEEHEDLKFIVKHEGDFVMAPNVNLDEYIDLKAHLTKLTANELPIFSSFRNIKRLSSSSNEEKVKVILDGVVIDDSVNMEKIIEQINKKSKTIMVYFSCLESLSEDQLNLAIIISQIDCVIVQNIDEVKKIMSIENLYPERTSISLSRNGNMNVKCVTNSTPNEVIQNSVIMAAYIKQAKFIIVSTKSGSTAIKLSKMNPTCYILAITQSEEAARKMYLYRKVLPFLCEDNTLYNSRGTDVNFSFAVQYLKKMQTISVGETVILLYRTSASSLYCENFCSLTVK